MWTAQLRSLDIRSPTDWCVNLRLRHHDALEPTEHLKESMSALRLWGAAIPDGWAIPGTCTGHQLTLGLRLGPLPWPSTQPAPQAEGWRTRVGPLYRSRT